VEVGQAVLALDLVDPELDLAERVLLVLLQVSQRDLNDAALEGIVGVLQTGGAVDQGLADTELLDESMENFLEEICLLAVGEGGRGLDAVPVLAGEGVNGLLLEALLALGQSLVPVVPPVSNLFS
jgi:hypothetical protein